MSFFRWSRTPASNGTADDTCPWPEGMPGPQVNDSARGMQAALAKYRDDTAGTLTTGGTSTAYTLTSYQDFDSLADMDGAKLVVKFNATSGAAPTLNVDSLGAKALQLVAGTAVPTGYFAQNSIWALTYDNANSAWIVHGSLVVLPTGSVATASIADAAVTLAKQANLAEKRAIGRNSSGSGVPEAITAEQLLDWIGSPAQGDILYRNATATVRLAAGSANQVLTSGGAAANPSWTTKALPLLHLQDRKSSGTDGQSLSSGAWTKRDLNTSVTNEISGASLASSQITLPAGTYEIDAAAPVFFQNNANITGQLKLRNTTDSTDDVIGVSWFQNASGVNVGIATNLRMVGRFTIAAQKVFEIQQFSGSQTATGGKAASGGIIEVYTDVMIRKIS